MPDTLDALHLTDSHLTATAGNTYRGLDPRATLARVIEAALASGRPDLVILGGDMSEDGSAESYAALRTQLLALELPVLVVPGNHDDPAGIRAGLPDAAFRHTGIVRHRGWQFALLDTHVPGSHAGALTAASLRHLDAMPDDAPTLVCLHHPPVLLHSAWLDELRLRNAAQLFERLDRRRHVRGILCGHVHQSYTATRHQVRLMTSPSTVCQFRPRVDGFGLDDRPPGARRLTLHADGRIDTHTLWSDA